MTNFDDGVPLKLIVDLLLTRLHQPIHLLQLSARPILHIEPHLRVSFTLPHSERIVGQRAEQAIFEHKFGQDVRWLQIGQHLQVVLLFAALLELHQDQFEWLKLFELCETIEQTLVCHKVTL